MYILLSMRALNIYFESAYHRILHSAFAAADDAIFRFLSPPFVSSSAFSSLDPVSDLVLQYAFGFVIAYVAVAAAAKRKVCRLSFDATTVIGIGIGVIVFEIDQIHRYC